LTVLNQTYISCGQYVRVVADVKFQENNYYRRPDNSEGTHPFNTVQLNIDRSQLKLQRL